MPLDGEHPNSNRNSGNFSSYPIGGGIGQPRQDNFSPSMTNQPTHHRTNHSEITATTQVEGI
ncbi:unnamed protein product [Linum tenue]|uniref:Uncharacterized protein n=1 Tax=Linum tenue TaxID=586396 RepID=A0AAV0RZJ0_9ROSI|nr:unnamed protein product [Linum tenue]CAI0625690.1 unnamed protein product [Linum tenue]